MPPAISSAARFNAATHWRFLVITFWSPNSKQVESSSSRLDRPRGFAGLPSWFRLICPSGRNVRGEPVTEISTLSLRARLILYTATWATALLTIDLRLWPLVYMFPTGLFAFIPPGQADGKWGLPLLFLGWIIYIAHAVFYFRARRRKTIWILYAALLLLFGCNVGGCHQMLRGTGYGR